jgi:hypothetical protein
MVGGYYGTRLYLWRASKDDGDDLSDRSFDLLICTFCIINEMSWQQCTGRFCLVALHSAFDELP